jgi:hypothetical protein
VTKEQKSRLRRVAGAIAGTKGTVMVTAVGFGSYHVAKMASERVNFLRSQWYMLPAAMAVGGHFLKRKNVALGAGLLGAAGYAFGMNWDFASAAKTAGKKPGEAGAMYDARDTSGAFDEAFNDAGAMMGGGPLADAPDSLPQGPAGVGDAGWDEYDVDDAMNLAA